MSAGIILLPFLLRPDMQFLEDEDENEFLTSESRFRE
jgi:hypothetical protein